MVFDFEENPVGANIDARAFLTHVQAQTGIWPGLYGGSYLKQTLSSKTDSVLQNSWFWLPQYGLTAVVPANWPTWTLWQYTDGAIGPNPRNIPGVGHCDQDCYNGTPDQLKQKWFSGSL